MLGDAGRATRLKTTKTVTVVTERKWRLAAEIGAPGGLFRFRLAAYRLRQAN